MSERAGMLRRRLLAARDRLLEVLFGPRDLGRRGELRAAHHLKKNGYTILERNFEVTRGEIDIVAFRRGVLAFVEVRSVTSPAEIEPLETITAAKQRRVTIAARRYVALHDLSEENVEIRFDAMTVVFEADSRRCTVRHVKNAFGPPVLPI